MSIDAFIAHMQRSVAGVPSNDDVPRDEMLLAVGLARRPRIEDGADGIATAVHGSEDWLYTDGDPVYSGAHNMTCGCSVAFGDGGDPDAYAAGAALAMALEGP